MTLRLQSSLNSNLLLALIIHTCCWILFIFYDLATVYFYTGKVGNISVHLLYYAINIGLFYVHTYTVLPLAFRQPRFFYLYAVGLILLETAMYLAIKGLVDQYIESFTIPINDRDKFSNYIFVNAWRGAYFMGFATAYWLIRRIIKYRTAAAQAGQELAEARNAYLQQQINPHFLFNTLNFVYNSVYKYSQPASECVLKLAAMMRYSLSEPDASGKTELADELEQIVSLININRLRYDFELFVDFEVAGNIVGLRIIPLTLLTLTENIFKHGNLKHKEMTAKILLSVDEQCQLKFITWNYKKKRNTAHPIKGIGLQNTIKRLNYSYGKSYSLEISDEHETYRLELNISL